MFSSPKKSRTRSIDDVQSPESQSDSQKPRTEAKSDEDEDDDGEDDGDDDTASEKDYYGHSYRDEAPHEEASKDYQNALLRDCKERCKTYLKDVSSEESPGEHSFYEGYEKYYPVAVSLKVENLEGDWVIISFSRDRREAEFPSDDDDDNAAEQSSPGTSTPPPQTYSPSASIPMVAMKCPPSTGTASNPFELPLDHEQWLKLKGKVEEILEYEFACEGLLREAMFPIQKGHAFLTQGSSDREFQQGNRKLAMLGDSVMRSVMMQVWFQRSETIGKVILPSDRTRSCVDADVVIAELDQRIAGKMSHRELARVAVFSGLEPIIRESFPGGIICGKHVLATTVKALVGAVWLDGMQQRDVVKTLLDNMWDSCLEVEE